MRSPALFLLLAAWWFWVHPLRADDPEELEPGAILSALDRQLRGRHGLLRHSSDDRGYTSETLTLRMELAASVDDRARFEADLARMQAYHLTDAGLLRWRLGKARDGWCSNASVDDLRAVRALLDAHERWGDDLHLALAVRMGSALLMNNVRDGVLVDSVSWPCDRKGRATGAPAEPGERLTLSFADLGALKALAPHDPRASGVLYRTRAVLLAGTLHPEGPRWGYTVPTKAFDRQDINPIHTELQRLQLLEGQPADSMGTATRLEVCGQVDEAWRTSDNVAHVAIAARRLELCGQHEAARAALHRLPAFMLDCGLLGYDHGDIDTVAWSFDNLQALLAWVEPSPLESPSRP